MNTEQILVTTWGQAEVLLRQLEDCKTFTYDSETSGLDWRVNHVVGHVIKPIDCPSYYVPLRHAGGGNFEGCRVPQTADGWKGDLHKFEIELGKITKSKPRRVVGHYLAFDLRFAHRVGVDFYGDYEDTMINQALLDENMRSFSLENTAHWCEAVAKKGDELYQYISSQFGGPADRKSMANYWRTNGSEFVVWDYAAGDGVSTEDVWAKQNKYIVEEGLELVHSVENRVIRTIHRMTLRGVRIDEAKLEEVDKLFVSRADELKRGFPDGFKSNAPTQLKAFLANRIEEAGDAWPRHAPTAAEIKKAQKEERDPVGALVFNEAVLKTVPEGRAILDVRKLEHAVSSFTAPMKNSHLWKGRVHCDFNQMKADDFGTVSGRLSCSNPNLQQVPKRDKFIGKEYRKCFLPEEGHIWYDNDYKQQEYVVFADYTRAPSLVAGYSADPPVDIHQSVADMLDVERDPTAKRMNLGMLYGMGKDKMAASLGVPVSQATQWINLYHQRMPEARQFSKRAEARAKQRGYVFTYLGRKRRFPDPRLAHIAANGIIQGSSADITKLKMAEIDDYFESEGDEFALMLQVHDSLSWTGPENPRINNEALRIMQSFGENDLITLGVPLRVDASTGANWSEATFGI